MEGEVRIETGNSQPFRLKKKIEKVYVTIKPLQLIFKFFRDQLKYNCTLDWTELGSCLMGPVGATAH